MLCVDEKSQIQALERTQPVRRVWPGPARAAHPRLPPARHHDPVRRAGGRHRARHQPVRSPPPPPGVPGLPQAGRRRLPTPAAARDLRQLRHPQAPGRARLAGQAPTHPAALHPDLGVLAEPGRGLLLDRGAPGAAPWRLPQRRPTSPPRSVGSARAGTSTASPSPGPSPPTRSSPSSTVKRLGEVWRGPRLPSLTFHRHDDPAELVDGLGQPLPSALGRSGAVLAVSIGSGARRHSRLR